MSDSLAASRHDRISAPRGRWVRVSSAKVDASCIGFDDRARMRTELTRQASRETEVRHHGCAFVPLHVPPAPVVATRPLAVEACAGQRHRRAHGRSGVRRRGSRRFTGTRAGPSDDGPGEPPGDLTLSRRRRGSCREMRP